MKLDFNFAPISLESLRVQVYPFTEKVFSQVPSRNNAAVHALPTKHSKQKIELSLEGREGEVFAVLKYSTWTDGLGWCGQKTIQFDAEQLDDLHHAITVARHRLNRQRAEAGQIVESAQIIQLPTIG